jgi:Uma2 family endonuclease
VEPSPDLVIEIDVTSYTDVNDYLPYQVPEVWLFKSNQLRIYSWQRGEFYQEMTYSRYFPNLNIKEIIAECMQVAYQRNTSAAIRQLRQKVASL